MKWTDSIDAFAFVVAIMQITFVDIDLTIISRVSWETLTSKENIKDFIFCSLPLCCCGFIIKQSDESVFFFLLKCQRMRTPTCKTQPHRRILLHWRKGWIHTQKFPVHIWGLKCLFTSCMGKIYCRSQLKLIVILKKKIWFCQFLQKSSNCTHVN